MFPLHSTNWNTAFALIVQKFLFNLKGSPIATCMDQFDHLFYSLLPNGINDGVPQQFVSVNRHQFSGLNGQ